MSTQIMVETDGWRAVGSLVPGSVRLVGEEGDKSTYSFSMQSESISFRVLEVNPAALALYLNEPPALPGFERWEL